VRITVGSCFDNVSLPGDAPIDITINNHSGETRQWVIQFTSPAYNYSGSNQIHSSFSVKVENNGTRTIPLLVPMSESDVTSGMSPVDLQVSGYGADAGSRVILNAANSRGGAATAGVAISESLGTGLWSSLDSDLNSKGRSLRGSTFDPAGLPEDWRGLSGISGMWMTGDELDRLDPAQREAIRTWVRGGGWLRLCKVNGVPPDFAFAGFGSVTAYYYAPDSSTLSHDIPGLPDYGRRFDVYSVPENKALTQIRPNIPLLLGMMAVFSIVVGPVNFFAFTRKRRERLFWTTPLISLCASGMLVSLIVVRDGIGGHGVRGAVVCIFPIATRR